VISFPLRYGRLAGPLLGVLGTGARFSGVDLDDDEIVVRMGWAFRGRAPRAFVVGAAPSADAGVLSRGAHGWGGDWLVNGAGDGIVQLRFEPPMRARVSGLPFTVRTLRVSVEDPERLLLAIG
jgi:hypothetical protein